MTDAQDALGRECYHVQHVDPGGLWNAIHVKDKVLSLHATLLLLNGMFHINTKILSILNAEFQGLNWLMQIEHVWMPLD